MTIGSRIKKLRQEENIFQVELAQKVGISKQTLYKYENDIITNIPSDKIELIAKELNTTPAYLMGWKEDNENLSGTIAHIDDKTPSSRKGVSINVLGRVAAGIPIEAIEDVIDTEEITEEMAKTGKFFGLQIHGNSMEPRIYEGDVVIVRQQEDAESGDVVIAMVNGDDATCKRLRKYRDGIELVPNNPSYEPMFFSNEEILNKPVKIIGKVVELRGKL